MAYTVAEAARVAGVKTTTIHARIRHGNYPNAYRVGWRWMIPASDLIAFDADGHEIVDVAGLPEELSTRDVADLTGRKVGTVAKWCKNGTLQARMVGGTWIINRDDLVGFRIPRTGPPRIKGNHG